MRRSGSEPDASRFLLIVRKKKTIIVSSEVDLNLVKLLGFFPFGYFSVHWNKSSGHIYSE